MDKRNLGQSSRVVRLIWLFLPPAGPSNVLVSVPGRDGYTPTLRRLCSLLPLKGLDLTESKSGRRERDHLDRGRGVGWVKTLRNKTDNSYVFRLPSTSDLRPRGSTYTSTTLDPGRELDRSGTLTPDVVLYGVKDHRVPLLLTLPVRLSKDVFPPRSGTNWSGPRRLSEVPSTRCSSSHLF